MKKDFIHKHSNVSASQVMEYFLRQAKFEREKKASREKVMDNLWFKATQGKEVYIVHKGN